MARRLWAARPSATRSVAIAFVAAVALSGAASVVAQARLPHRLPSARDWAALRSLLEREGRPGDAAALSPPWAERAREALPAALPVLAARRYAGEDLLGVRRVWLVSVPRAPGFSWEPEEDLLARGAPAGAPARLGALEVRRLQLSFPVLPLSFLPDRLATAGAASAVREVREIAGAPRPCLVARVGAAGPVALRFTPVRVGRVVRGHVGAVGAGALPGAVRVAVGVDGEEAGTAEISGAGFVPFQVDTTRFAGQVRPISLRVSAGGADAELCLDAATLP
ncbi:MAG TPA: hypothetical protein VFK90_09215 [Anaeromyxobacter sp.]|nr:hypothetical protein [Anaeromyxobacter sp.]